MQDQGAGRLATHHTKKNESRVATVCEESDHGASSANFNQESSEFHLSARASAREPDRRPYDYAPLRPHMFNFISPILIFFDMVSLSKLYGERTSSALRTIKNN